MNPALFYFIEHDPNTSHLVTDKFKELVRRSEVLCVECVGSDLDQIREEETKWNECTASGDLSQFPTIAPPFSSLGYLLAGSGKRIVLEKSLKPEWDHGEVYQQFCLAFYDATLERAFEIAQAALGRIIPYHQEREARVAQDLTGITEKTLIIFGLAHRPLADIVASIRPVEVHTPFEDSNLPIECLVMDNFRKTGKLDRELYMRSVLEASLLKAIEGYRSYNRAEKERIAAEYVKLFTTDQIIALRDAYLRLQDQHPRATIGDAFERFVQKNNFPTVPDMARKLLPRKRTVS